MVYVQVDLQSTIDEVMADSQPIVSFCGTSSNCTEFLRKVKTRKHDFFRPECTVLIQLLKMLPLACGYAGLVGAGSQFQESRPSAGLTGLRAGRIGKCGHIFSELGIKTKINTPVQGRP